jgi:NAD dependent epimerase/dehydratase family enzyme
MSWVALDDVLGAIHHALVTPTVSGPLNVVAPKPVTNREFTKTLGRVLRRPTVAAVPAFALRLAFGEMADGALLASTRVSAARLLASGYAFRFPELEGALRHALGRQPA